MPVPVRRRFLPSGGRAVINEDLFAQALEAGDQDARHVLEILSRAEKDPTARLQPGEYETIERLQERWGVFE